MKTATGFCSSIMVLNIQVIGGCLLACVLTCLKNTFVLATLLPELERLQINFKEGTRKYFEKGIKFVFTKVHNNNTTVTAQNTLTKMRLDVFRRNFSNKKCYFLSTTAVAYLRRFC